MPADPTFLLDAVHEAVHIWVGKCKVAKASADVIVVHAIVVGELQGEVVRLWPSSHESIAVLLLHDNSLSDKGVHSRLTKSEQIGCLGSVANVASR
jgi:hypothetical protein